MFLRKAIDPPKLSAIESAWETLKELGAVDEDGKITALGRHMVSPTDICLWTDVVVTMTRLCCQLTLGSQRCVDCAFWLVLD